MLASVAESADFVYTGQTVTETAQDAYVTGRAGADVMTEEGDAILKGYGNITISDNTTQNTYSGDHTTVDAYIAAGGALYAEKAVIITANSGTLLSPAMF